MKINNNNLAHIGDILAIPFFALLTYYFYNKKNNIPMRQTINIETLLYMFAITGLIADIYFTFVFLKK
jgi:hypothetical protein